MTKNEIMFGYSNKEGMPHAYSRAELSGQYVESILAPLKLNKNSIILDLACGGGHESRALKQISGGTVIESDFNMEAYRSNPSPERQFVAADIQALPFAENSFDLVHLKDGLVHIPDKRKFFADVNKILKPSGKLVVVTDCTKRKFREHLGFFVVSQGEQERLIYFNNFVEFKQLLKEEENDLEKNTSQKKEISLPYFHISKEDVVKSAEAFGLQQIQGIVPPTWHPGPDEKNWGDFNREVFIFKKLAKQED